MLAGGDRTMGKQMNNLFANQTHHRDHQLRPVLFHSVRGERSENGSARLRTVREAFVGSLSSICLITSGLQCVEWDLLELFEIC